MKTAETKQMYSLHHTILHQTKTATKSFSKFSSICVFATRVY